MLHYWGPLLAAALLAIAGCNVDFSSSPTVRTNGEVIAEGTLYRVRYETGEGTVEEISRTSLSRVGGGLKNVDAHAQLTNDALVITYAQRPGFGPHVIPMNRLLEVQFGDGLIANPGSIGTPDEHDHQAAADHGRDSSLPPRITK